MNHLRYTLAPCPLGLFLLAASPRGARALTFGDDEQVLLDGLRQRFVDARLLRDDAALGPYVEQVQRHLAGRQPQLDIPLDVPATPFRARVWEALRNIGYGETQSYAQVAAGLGQPSAARAVAAACAANPVALLTPCHRVVRGDGSPSGFRWGAWRKQMLLAAEAAAQRCGLAPSPETGSYC